MIFAFNLIFCSRVPFVWHLEVVLRVVTADRKRAGSGARLVRSV